MKHETGTVDGQKDRSTSCTQRTAETDHHETEQTEHTTISIEQRKH